MNIRKKLNIRERLKQLIKESPEKIESELKRSSNDWLACFGTRIFIIEIHLGLKEVNETISLEELEKFKMRLEELKQAKFEFRQNNKEPSEEEKQELLSQLDLFKEK